MNSNASPYFNEIEPVVMEKYVHDYTVEEHVRSYEELFTSAKQLLEYYIIREPLVVAEHCPESLDLWAKLLNLKKIH